MKKNEYVAPELEIVEITELCGILAGSGEGEEDGSGDTGGGNGTGVPQF